MTLNDAVSPLLTLIEVAKPWMVESPEPVTDHALEGSPGCAFSQAIVLGVGGPHRRSGMTAFELVDPVRLLHLSHKLPLYPNQN